MRGILSGTGPTTLTRPTLLVRQGLEVILGALPLVPPSLNIADHQAMMSMVTLAPHLHQDLMDLVIMIITNITVIMNTITIAALVVEVEEEDGEVVVVAAEECAAIPSLDLAVLMDHLSI